jgi:CubicO group peptidase (beta-lactamase class C family)
MASLSRRSALGLLGAVPLAASGTLALAPAAQAGPDRTPAGRPPAALLPGGAYDRYVSGQAADDLFSGTVLVAWRGEPTLIRSYHWADRANGIPNRTGTIFKLGSLAKFFDGTAVAQLAAQGKVDYYATLGTYLDGFPSDIADHVTVHQLLTHTSGFPFQAPPSSPDWTTRVEAFEGELGLLRQQELVSTPGTTYAYSNSNYFLAQAIVAAVSGEYYWNYGPRHIFGPAGMTGTGFYSDQRWHHDPRIAHLFGPPVPGGQRVDVTDLNSGKSQPNTGAGFSTAPDLLRFARAVTDGTLLPRAWAEVLTSGKYPIAPSQYTVDEPPGFTLLGYGCDERIVNDQRAYGHTGALETPVPGATQPGGGSTALTVYPDLDVIVVVLSNYFLYPGIGTFLTEQDRIITQQAT